MNATRIVVLCGLIALIGLPATAQTGGGVPVRIPDDAEPRCIDPAKDRIWVTLLRLITTRRRGWFTRDRGVAVLMNTILRADPSAPKTLEYPLLSMARFGNAPRGQVSVPIEYPIASGLELTEGDTSFTGMTIDITLLNLRERTGLGIALKALGDVTGAGKLSIPSNPLAQGLSYLLDFANTAIRNDVDAQDPNDVAKSAELALSFDPSGQCRSGNFETTGTRAVVYSEGEPGPGYVDISKILEYCWAVEVTPAFVLKVAKKKPGVPCGPEYEDEYVGVTNNYIALFVNKQIRTDQGGAIVALEQDRRDSIARCRFHGIPEEACPGAVN